jgi:hypothetical protein
LPPVDQDASVDGKAPDAVEAVVTEAADAEGVDGRAADTPQGPAQRGHRMDRRLVVLWATALAICAGSVVSKAWAYPEYSPRPPLGVAAQAISGGLVLLSAALIWRRQPTNRLWALMLWFGVAGFLQDFGPPNLWILSIGLVFSQAPATAFVHLTLAYPTGRLRRRYERVLVAASYVYALIAAFRWAFVPFGECDGGCHTITYYKAVYFIADRPQLAASLQTIQDLLALAFGIGLVVCLISRAVVSRHGPRRVRLPLVLTATLVSIWFLSQLNVAFPNSIPNFWIALVVQAVVPAAFAAAILT